MVTRPWTKKQVQLLPRDNALVHLWGKSAISWPVLCLRLPSTTDCFVTGSVILIKQTSMTDGCHKQCHIILCNAYHHIIIYSLLRAYEDNRRQNLHTPVGKSMNSCIASLFPAWLPPLITLNAGTGSTSCELPARSAMWRYSGTP